jgi:putative membrane protein
MNAERPRPRAFRLDGDGKVALDETAAPRAAAPVIEEVADPYEREADAALAARPTGEQAVEVAQKQGVIRRSLMSWGGLFWSATGALLSIGVTLWLTQFIEGLFARNPVLGSIGLALAGLAGLALLVMGARELLAVSRQRAIAQLHVALAEAREKDDRDAARRHVIELTSLYDRRPDMARGRAHLEDLTREIVDGRDLIDIAERVADEPARRRRAAARSPMRPSASASSPPSARAPCST